MDAAKGAVEGVAAAISNTSDSVVESSVTSSLEAALDNATSVVEYSSEFSRKSCLCKLLGGTPPISSCSGAPSLTTLNYAAVPKFGYVVFNQ